MIKPLLRIVPISFFLFFYGEVSSQPLNLPEEAQIPLIDGYEADFVGSIVDTDLNRVLNQLQQKGILRPEFGIEDVFLTPSSKTVLDFSALGPHCIRDTVQGIITSSNNKPKSQSKVKQSRGISSGKALGSTQLIVSERLKEDPQCEKQEGRLLKVFRITVAAQDLVKIMQELRALLGHVEGLNIRIVGSQIIIDGQVIAPKEIVRIEKVLQKMGEGAPILSLYEVSPLSKKLLAEKMEESIAGGPDRPRNIKVKVINGRFFLQGSVDKRSQREEAMNICLSFLQPKKENEGQGTLAAVPPKDSRLSSCMNYTWIRQGQPKEPDPIINVRIDFVTMSKKYSKFFDFSMEANCLGSSRNRIRF